MAFLDVTSAVGTVAHDAVHALRLKLNADLGYPKASIDPSTGQVDPRYPTTDHTFPWAHPVNGQRFALPLRAGDVARVNAAIAVAAAAVAAGTATAAQKLIAALPAPVASLDASWNVVGVQLSPQVVSK